MTILMKNFLGMMRMMIPRLFTPNIGVALRRMMKNSIFMILRVKGRIDSIINRYRILCGVFQLRYATSYVLALPGLQDMASIADYILNWNPIRVRTLSLNTSDNFMLMDSTSVLLPSCSITGIAMKHIQNLMSGVITPPA